MTKSAFTPSEQSNPFADTEDKSLESQATEAKGADAPEPEAEPIKDGVEVKLLHHTSYNGKDYVPGKTATFPRAKALSLIAAKRAKSLD